MESTTSFGYWLRRRRKALDMTQDDLAQRAGCAVATIRKIEGGLRRPSRQLAERLAALLGIHPDERPTFLKVARAELVPDRLDIVAHPLDIAPHPVVDPVYRPVARDLPAELSAPQTLDRPTSLPIQPTPLVGRRQEVAAIQQLLGQDEVRLVTLTGPGGTGKTRLGIQAAAEMTDSFRNGVCFVALASISDPALVPSVIAQALGIKEAGDQGLTEVLKSYLRDRQLLLVVDNFEQVLAAAPVLSDLLTATQRLKLLITSRAVLHLRGEKELPVPPLALPTSQHPSLGQLLESEAVRLFIARAQDVRPDMSISHESALAITEICRRLDGLPLAIELAAARVRVLSPQIMLGRMASRLALLTGGPRDLPAHQQTLRRTIQWSYDLLGPAEQQLFRRLAVFVGSFTLEAAERICDGMDDPGLAPIDGITSLLDKSLLRKHQESERESRFAMLETIREYALEQLDQSGEAGALRQRHLEDYQAWAEQIEPSLTGPQQGALMQQLEHEHDNIRAALAWALEQREPEQALRLAGAVWKFWQIHSYLSEGRRWLEAGLAQSAALQTSARAKALWGAGWLAWMLSDIHGAQTHFTQSLGLARALGDRAGIGRALHGVAVLDHNDKSRTQAMYEESLAIFRALGDREETAWSLMHLGSLMLHNGDTARAQTCFDESLALFRLVGNRWGIAMVHVGLGRAAQEQSQYTRARAALEEGLTLLREFGDRATMAWAIETLGLLALYQRDLDQATNYYTQSIALCRAIEAKIGFASCLEGLGGVALAQGRVERAARLWGAAEAIREAIEMGHSRVDRRHNEEMIAAGRAKLGTARFDAAWASGRALSLEQALAYALDRDP